MSEQEQYITLNDAAREVGIQTSSLYYYLHGLAIETHHFQYNRNAFILRGDVERIKTAKNEPWKFGLRKQKRGPKSKKKVEESNVQEL